VVSEDAPADNKKKPTQAASTKPVVGQKPKPTVKEPAKKPEEKEPDSSDPIDVSLHARKK